MTQRLAEQAAKRHVVVLLHQPVLAPVLLDAPGRAYHHPAQINGRFRFWPRRLDQRYYVQNEMVSTNVSSDRELRCSITRAVLECSSCR